MKTNKEKPAPPVHVFAWDGVSFEVPETWHLAGYVFERNVTRVELEDDYAVRLEAEWARLKHRVNLRKVQERFSRAARKLVDAATKSTKLPAPPPCLSSHLYSMPDKTSLLTSLLLTPESKLACFLRIYFGPKDREQPRGILERIARSFRVHEGATIPWTFYDISLELPSDFRLVNSQLQAGRKLLTFQWRLRRLYVWHLSLADILLKDRRLEEWGAEFLNAFKTIRGPKFSAGVAGQIQARRAWPYVFGQFEEIARQCFRYKARCIHDTDKNRVILWVFNYRKEQDLEKIPGSLRK